MQDIEGIIRGTKSLTVQDGMGSRAQGEGLASDKSRNCSFFIKEEYI